MNVKDYQLQKDNIIDFNDPKFTSFSEALDYIRGNDPNCYHMWGIWITEYEYEDNSGEYLPYIGYIVIEGEVYSLTYEMDLN